MLDCLPFELLELILIEKCIGHNDIAAVVSLCRRLRHCADSNELWKVKFKQRWPAVCERVVDDPVVSWRDCYKLKIECGQRVRHLVAQMSARYHKREELPKDAFISLGSLSRSHPFGHSYVVDELNNILNDSHMYNNLTLKYYAKKALCFVKRDQLESEWIDFMMLPTDVQSIEKGSIMIAQWFQPSLQLDEQSVGAELDQVASLVAANVRKLQSDQSVVKECSLVTDVVPQWTARQRIEILNAISWTLFEELGLCEDITTFYLPDNSFLNRAIERKAGISLTLCVLYMCIARRLGVSCDIVTVPSKCILRFEKHPLHRNSGQFIDVCCSGQICSLSDLALPATELADLAPLLVFERMIRNVLEAGRRLGNMSNGIWFVRSALELLLILRPNDVDARLLLARIYLHLNVNLTEVLSSLQEVLARDPSQTGVVAYMYRTCQSRLSIADLSAMSSTFPHAVDVQQRSRDESISFAIGMIMEHRQYNYTCVIYGWDALCSASRDWILQMGVHRLPKREFQPFYNVLADDGSVRYAAQENLRISPEPRFIQHPFIGKYFTAFAGTYFVPNEQMCREYPADELVRSALLSQRYC